MVGCSPRRIRLLVHPWSSASSRTLMPTVAPLKRSPGHRLCRVVSPAEMLSMRAMARVHLNHITGRIVNANHRIMRVAVKLGVDALQARRRTLNSRHYLATEG